jgi:mannose-6-phosphate isomerase-like protein (cupin superfamily)
VEWHWAALGLWYAALGYVLVWSHRSRRTWKLLDAYPLGFRVRLLLPFTAGWRPGLRPEDRESVLPFRRRFLVHTYLVVLLPPLLIFGWLYGRTYVRYANALERRAYWERRTAEILARADSRAPRAGLGHPVAFMDLERWQTGRDGPPSEDALRRDLEARGFRVTRYVYAPGTVFPPHTHDADKVDAVVSGRFRMTMEGLSVVLEAGDRLAVPRGTLHSAEVVGSEPVVSLDATRP